MSSCSVKWCGKSSRTSGFKKDGITFHRRNNWLKAIGREDLLLKLVDGKTRQQYRVCEEHFERNCIKLSKNKTVKYLFDYAFPTLKLPSNEDASSSSIQENTFPTEQSEFAENSGNVVVPTTSTSYSNVEPLGSGFVDDPGSLSPSASEVSINGNEIKVFCPKCNTEVSHTAEGIQQDQTKILIAKVYHYFEQEYEDLKKIYGDLDLTPLSKFCQRTALATGVSETMLMQILKEEERRNEERQRELLQKERAARKRRRQTTYSSSEEDSSDDNVEDIEQPSPSEETLVVKIEPPEYDLEEPEIFIPAVKVEPSDDDTNKEQTDPIALDLKREQQDDDDELNNTDASPAPETSATKRKAKKTPRLGDETSVQQQTQAECSTSAAWRSKRRETEESCLPVEVEIKLEEGFT